MALKKTMFCGLTLVAVDICITTDYKDLEHVCLLAEVLAKRKDDHGPLGVRVQSTRAFL